MKKTSFIIIFILLGNIINSQEISSTQIAKIDELGNLLSIELEKEIRNNAIALAEYYDNNELNIVIQPIKNEHYETTILSYYLTKSVVSHLQTLLNTNRTLNKFDYYNIYQNISDENIDYQYTLQSNYVITETNCILKEMLFISKDRERQVGLGNVEITGDYNSITDLNLSSSKALIQQLISLPSNIASSVEVKMRNYNTRNEVELSQNIFNISYNTDYILNLKNTNEFYYYLFIHEENAEFLSLLIPTNEDENKKRKNTFTIFHITKKVSNENMKNLILIQTTKKIPFEDLFNVNEYSYTTLKMFLFEPASIKNLISKLESTTYNIKKIKLNIQ